MLESSILLGLVLIVLNVLDSVTTEIGLNHMPLELRPEESNPWIRGMIKNDNLLSHIIKQTFVVLVALFLIYKQNQLVLLMAVLMFGVVVFENAWIIIIRLLAKKKYGSPLHYLFRLCRVPKRFDYYALLVLLIPSSYIMAKFLLDNVG